MASASDHRAHAALQPADCLILLPQRLPAAVETSIGLAHYPAECTQSDAFLQPSLRARKGRANSNSFRVARLAATRAAGLGLPRRNRCFREPHGQAPALAQRDVIGSPVRHSVPLLRDVMTAILVRFEWHGGCPGSETEP